MPQQNWYLLTGPPSTGKSTSIERMEELFGDFANLNSRMGYGGFPVVAILKETARVVIDAGVDPGSQEFVDQVSKLQRFLESQMYNTKVLKDFIVIVDRTLLDVYAYSRLQDTKTPFSYEDLRNWMQRYDHAFLYSAKGTLYDVSDGVRRAKGPSRASVFRETLLLLEELNVPHTIIEGPAHERHLLVSRHIRADIDRDFMGDKLDPQRSFLERPVQQAMENPVDGGGSSDEEETGGVHGEQSGPTSELQDGGSLVGA